MKNPEILKNPKFSTKTQKLGQERKMHDERMKKRHTKSRKCSLRLNNTWVGGLEWKREVWEMRRQNNQKRLRRNEEKSCGTLYIEKS